MLSTMCTNRKKDVVLVESPTYFLAPNIFRNHGLMVVGVETDGEGIVIASLLTVLQQLELSGQRAAMLYVIPVHHNPTGRTMPEARRKSLVRIAAEHNFLVIADEVYTLLTYGAAPPPSMASLGDNVLSLGSFSKILAPGLRVGWIEGSPEQLKQLLEWGVIDSGGHLSHFASCVVSVAMKSQMLDTHLAQLRKVYQERCKCLVEALEVCLPADCSLARPEGGYFVWVQLPAEADAKEVASAPEKFGFLAKPGPVFSTLGAGSDNCLRLCFARLQPTQLIEGVKRVAAAIKHVRGLQEDKLPVACHDKFRCMFPFLRLRSALERGKQQWSEAKW